MPRDKDVDSVPLLQLPVKPRRLISLAASPTTAKARSVSRRRWRRKRQRESILSWWEGQFGKVVAISFLGNSPDSRSVDARSPSSVKPNRQRGPASSCPQISVLVSLHGLGEVGVETSDKFCEFFCNFGKENQRGRIDSTWFRVRRGWWGRERNF